MQGLCPSFRPFLLPLVVVVGQFSLCAGFFNVRALLPDNAFDWIEAHLSTPGIYFKEQYPLFAQAARSRAIHWYFAQMELRHGSYDYD
ncbi:unnamed protein product, partial [Polarella glacialis]